jgi:ABC-type cobalt transport system substrate-binding protein
MKEENLKIVAACLLTLVVSVLINFLTTDKIAERVIQKLKRDYVPGPYEPGFDPDKVPPGSIKKL